MAATRDRSGIVVESGDGGAPSPEPAVRGDRGTKSYAVAAGVLFIVATAASLLSAPFLAPVRDSDFLVVVAAHRAQVGTGALLGLVAALASTGIAVALSPVLRRSSEGLAIGAVAFRVVEGVLAIVGVTALVSLLSVSEQFVEAGGVDRASYAATGQALLAVQHWVADVGSVIAFSLGGLLYYLAFYRTRLIPRWLSGWGVIGVTALAVSAVLVVYGVIGPLSTTQIIIAVPIAVQEMVLAVWLIVKGFNTIHPEPTPRTR